MKKIIPSVFFTTAIIFSVKAQSMKCGNDFLMEKIKNDTAYQRQIHEQEKKIQEWVQNNPNSRSRLIHTSINYPKIKGFTATGNSKIDAVNYAKVKEELMKNNPEEFRKLFESAEPNKILEEEKKKDRAKKIESEKLNTH